MRQNHAMDRLWALRPAIGEISGSGRRGASALRTQAVRAPAAANCADVRV
ncbi:MAG: hypothetical protein AVDCRST_MAG67-3682 [uncultured Solirubrobacteraceae bacterium]|uniref:Uncharacterized protein n=1 Tax=uncultured Solirubrobacteraceae bacterium TaxID=1162706 RepID=A0A6J4TL93_9ACTN|nr:MAG: hypothetical protein AVDCRST_MAG67-3682 [uncultured Solirubrobacteraceae bacterium]